MDTITKFIQSLSGYCWPIIVLIILISFRKSINNLIESARNRKFTIKVGNNELTMEEANEQQRKIIEDIQNQIIKIENQLVSTKNRTIPMIGIEMESVMKNKKTILWVDDNPKNNAILIEYLNNQGNDVMTALSTDEAMSIMKNKHIDRIITNMGRRESGIQNRTAGIDFIKKVRAIDKEIIIILFCNPKNYSLFHKEAELSRASLVTSSSTEMIKALNLN
jgi:CheY-like chemotaxis protein